MKRLQIVLAAVCLLTLAGCAGGPLPDQALSVSSAAAKNNTILVGRIESFHKEHLLNQWVAGSVKIALTPAGAPPFFNDLTLCPGRTALSEPCGWRANGILFGPDKAQPWSSLNSFVMEVPAGSYSLTLIEASPYLWGVKPTDKSRLPLLTLKPGEVVNLGVIKAFFASPQVNGQFKFYSKYVATKITAEADEAGARAFLAAANPALAGALVTRLLPTPSE